MDRVRFSCVGEVRGKGRPRTRIVRPKHGGSSFATIYTDPVTRKYEASIKAIAEAAMGGHPPFTGPLSASIRLRIGIPKSATKATRAALLAGEEPPGGRIDNDNGGKAVMDACNKVCFVDDRQIVRLWIERIASERPGIDVQIIALAPQAPA